MQPTRYSRAIGGVLVGLLLLAAADTTAQPDPQAPTVTLNPPCGALGTQITATGSGWGAAAEIQVFWNPAQGASNPPLATTGVNRSNGTIRVSFTVPPNFRPDNTIQFVGTPVEPGAQPIQVSQPFRIPCGAPAAPPGAPLASTRPAAGGRWTTASLSVPRMGSRAAVVGSQVLFVGGLTNTTGPDTVDIYDSTSDEWSTAPRSGRRLQNPPVVVVGSKVVIFGEDGIDIYDSSTATWTTITPPTRRTGSILTATVGTKALFAGGQPSGGSRTLDIYDAATDAWSTSALPVDHGLFDVATVGTKVLLAGGFVDLEYTDRVDIYDTATDSWSTGRLSVARADIATATIGGTVLFAGGRGEGDALRVVDVYDSRTEQWTTATLSAPRLRRQTLPGDAPTTVEVVGTQVLFADARSTAVDIYDAATGRWATGSLSRVLSASPGPSAGLVTAAAGTQVLFTWSDNPPSPVVDVYDSATGQWSSASLSTARLQPTAAVVGTTALFAGGYTLGGDRSLNRPMAVVDVYDAASGTWSTAALAEARDSPTTAVVDGKVVFAGGEISCRGCGPRVLAAVDVYHSPP